MKILNFGSLNIDYVYRVSHIVLPGETISSDGYTVCAGGKGLNQSVALAKAGAPVYHAGLIGDEGSILIKVLEDSGADAGYIERIPGKSGHTIIQVDDAGQNSIILYGGSNRAITKEYVDRVLEGFDEGDYLLLQNEISMMPYIIDRAYEKGMRLVLNPSPYNDNIASCDLNKISLFFINEIEGEQISGFSKPDEIIAYMLDKYQNAAVVLTLVSAGAIYADNGVRIHQPVFETVAVDTTAAGDTFTGYFLSLNIMGKSCKECLRWAAKAASLAVSKEGAAQSIPEYAQVEKALI